LFQAGNAKRTWAPLTSLRRARVERGFIHSYDDDFITQQLGENPADAESLFIVHLTLKAKLLRVCVFEAQAKPLVENG
jgi:hypothetical protein